MAFIIKDTGGGAFQPAPEGSHAAVCTKILDMGIQESGQYGPKHKVMIEWEIAEEMEDGRPFTVTGFYNLSLNEKSSLRSLLEGWRGKAFSKEELAGFDIEKLLGVTCLLNVIHNEAPNGNVYANVKSASRLPKGLEGPEPSGELLIFSSDDPKPEVLAKLHEKLADKITSGVHRLKENNGTAYVEQKDARNKALEELDDEIPF